MADDLSKAIIEELETFNEQIDQAVKKVINDVAKEAQKEIRRTGDYKNRTGEYRKGFKLKKQRGQNSLKITLHNKEYRLTHLLEYSHDLPNGGKTKPHPHWQKAQEIADTLPERIKEAIDDIQST